MRAAIVVALVVLSAACTSSPAGAVPPSGPALPTPPSGGLTRDQAVAIATAQLVSTTPLHLRSATAGPIYKFWPNTVGPISSPDEWVWALTFDGTFVHPCPAPPAPCEPAHQQTVLVDYLTGKVLFFVLRT